MAVAPAAPTAPPAASAPANQIIPDAGVYGAETAAAINAYNNAVAQAAAQRNALYQSYGLTNAGSVDPNNPTGAYQQMLRGQNDQYTADQQNAASRGIGLGGLGRQAETHDRNDAQAQDFDFQNQVASVGSDYQNALMDALNTKQGAISQAHQDAIQTALQNQLDNMTSGNYNAPGTGKTKVAPDSGNPGPPGGKKPGGHGNSGGAKKPPVKQPGRAHPGRWVNGHPQHIPRRGGGSKHPGHQQHHQAHRPPPRKPKKY